MTLRTTLTFVVIFPCILFSASTRLSAQGAPESASKVIVDSDGAVQIPGYTVPLSSFLSPQAKAYVAEHLRDMQNPELLKQDQGVPRFMKHYLERDETIFAVERKDASLGGVHTYTYTPRSGISEKNKARVLINLHGGGFSGCWPGCAELESMPISALMNIKVVTVDYREGPDNKFPAASEDVASVYRELLKTYKPQNIGIYGCSAGGMLTAMSLAWFQTHGLPTPGAVGIYCASAGAFGGDATYIAFPFGEGRMPPTRPPGQSQLGYFSGADIERSARIANEFTRDVGKVSADVADYRDQGLRDEWNDPHGCRANKKGRQDGAACVGRAISRILL